MVPAISVVPVVPRVPVVLLVPLDGWQNPLTHIWEKGSSSLFV